MGGSRNLRIINRLGVEVGGINKQIGMKISSDHITSGGGVHNTLGGAHQLWGDRNNKKYQTRKVFPQKFFFYSSIVKIFSAKIPSSKNFFA